MIELIKRYKVAIILSSLLMINLCVLLYQSNQKDPVLLTNVPSQEIAVSQDNNTISLEENKATLSNSSKEQIEMSEPMVISSVATTPVSVPVYICGAVKVPGVYYVMPTAIVDEVIRLSGGFNEEADTTAINLAASIIANEKIIVPKIGEEIDKVVTSYDNTIKSQSTKSNLININTASSNELMSLPGIGEVKAQAIINYRETVSAFRSVEELKEVSGIGDKTFEKLKALITV